LGEERLAVSVVALTPAFERSDDVGRADRLRIVELQAVAQGEGVGELVVAHRPPIDHLRLRPGNRHPNGVS